MFFLTVPLALVCVSVHFGGGRCDRKSLYTERTQRLPLLSPSANDDAAAARPEDDADVESAELS